MMNFLYNDMIQLISQYSPQVYCLFRLVNKEWKDVVDEVLPSGSMEQKVRFLQGAHCGFKLLDGKDFDAWLDAMDRVYGNEGISGETVEKFCRDYQRNAKNQGMMPRMEQNVLHVLCKYNRIEYLRELWDNVDRESFCCDWMKEVGMLDDFEFVTMVHEQFASREDDKDVVRIAIQGALKCYQWKNTNYLLKNHPEMKENEVLKRNSKFLFAAGDQNVFRNDVSLQNDRKVVLRSVMENGLSLYHAESFKRDRQIVLEAVNQNGTALQFADNSLKKDKTFILETVTQFGFTLQYADNSLKKDRSFILETVRNNGDALHYADDTFKNDKDVVLEAVKQKGSALEYMGPDRVGLNDPPFHNKPHPLVDDMGPRKRVWIWSNCLPGAGTSTLKKNVE